MTAAASTANTATTSQGTVEHLDPRTLVLEANVREDAPASQGYAELMTSIRNYGVLSPLTAVRSPQGEVTVRDGQRRLMAAREAGLATVPVYVTADLATTEQERTVARITEQIVVNDHRAPLTETQRAKGIQQLLLEGLTPAKVAKSLTVPKALVEAAATATGSEQAMSALSHAQLSISQAAILADFDTDPEAVQYLTEAGSAGDFEHRVAELRPRAASAQARESAEAPSRDKGYRLLTERPGWNDELMATRWDRLCDAAGNSIAAAVTEHDPQLWAVWLDEVEIYEDSRTGEEVDEGDIDWDIDAADHDAAPEEGYVHPRFIVQRTTFEAEFFCLDIDAAGVMTRSQYYQRSRPGGNTATTDHGAEQRREAELRDKRKVVALNKLGLAAIEVRREWVKNHLLARKTPPQGAALFIAAQLAKHPSLLIGSYSASTAAELLAVKDSDTVADTIAALPAAADARAIVITLGLVLGALEAETPKDAWRRRYTNYSKDYLRYLADNGYELSDIEKVITGQAKDDAVYDRIAAAKTKAPKAG
ncbi:ParB/RepB/Spo0J family partition protein [Mycobacterium simiae]|uniref:ParB/RepB/Spo0J family partition protein n=1 Tax=Mycobacterium simiae TaxID=1784 RepID=UPI00260A467A|nr:ParB N-terminal domain-containing protein [Mycobacterium simiae]